MDAKFHKLIDKLEPFLISANLDAERVKNSVFTQEIREELKFNPLKLSSKNFIDRIYHLDSLSFGGQGMGMDKWVFFDCSAMPGFVFGYGIRASHLSYSDKKLLQVSGGEEFIPVSMYIAIPNMSDDESWFGHNLSSLNSTLDEDLSGLGLLTKQGAIEVMGIKKLIGATQWDSAALAIHTQISDLKVLSSYTPIHSKNNTLCYESFPLNNEVVLSGERRDDSMGEFFIPSETNLIELQKEIESGLEVFILGKQKTLEGKQGFFITKKK